MKNILCFSLMMVLASQAHASFQCKGTVKSIALGPKSGVVQVNTGFGVHYLCQLHQSFNGVPPEVCQGWYSMFLTAQASGREIAQSYNPDASAAQNCEQLGSWKVPNPFPYYVALAE